jgi:hypothetical protein
MAVGVGALSLQPAIKSAAPIKSRADIFVIDLIIDCFYGFSKVFTDLR